MYESNSFGRELTVVPADGRVNGFFLKNGWGFSLMSKLGGWVTWTSSPSVSTRGLVDEDASEVLGGCPALEVIEGRSVVEQGRVQLIIIHCLVITHDLFTSLVIISTSLTLFIVLMWKPVVTSEHLSHDRVTMISQQ